MAVIDSKKLLPPSKSSGSALATQKFLVPVENIKPKSSAIIKASDILSSKKGSEESGGKITLNSEIVKINKHAIQIEKIIGNNNTLLKKIEESKRKDSEKQKFEKRETQLEEKKGGGLSYLKTPSLPRTGFLDAIKRFLFYTLLGSAFEKFGKYIPKILEFSKKLIPAFKFLEDFAGNVLNGVVDFVGAGYKAYDKVREITKQVGGEDLQSKFDEFSKQFNTFANLAIIAGMSTMGGTDFSDKGGKPTTRKPGFDKVRGGRVDKATQSRYLSRYGKDAFTKRFGQQSLTKLAGKTTGKGIGRLAGKALGRVPIIGGLIDFIISTVIFREKPGRAAAKAVGATIGSTLGTFVPVPFAGTILGGILGDIVGGALYDSLVGNDTVKARAQGGQVTRGGQRVSGPSRRIKRVVSRPPKTKPQRTIPGRDVGGRNEIKKLFFEPTPPNPKIRNPLGVLETASNSYKQMGFIGEIMGISLDSVMGQKTDSRVFKKIGLGLGSLIQNAINSETSNTISGVQKEIAGLANGGIVPRTLSSDENIGMRLGEKIAKTLEIMVNSKVNETLLSIRQQFAKEGFGLTGPDGQLLGPGGEFDEASINANEMDLFQRMVYAEAGGEGKVGMALVARAILNRAGLIQSGKVGSATFSSRSGSISDVIRAPGQFSPISNGRIRQRLTQSQLNQALDAIRLAQNPSQLIALLKNEGLDDTTVNKLAATTGFRNYNAGAGYDPSQTVNEVTYKRHTFNTAGNASLLVPKGVAIQLAPPAGQVSASIFEAAKSLKGMSTAAGPGGGNVSCVWAVNRVFSRARVPTPWGGAQSTDQVIYGLQRNKWLRVSARDARPGDIWVYDAADGRRGHVGIMMDNGRVLSNSSGQGKFVWEATPQQLLESYPASGLTPPGGAFYRAPGAQKPVEAKKQKPVTKPTEISSSNVPGSSESKSGLNPIVNSKTTNEIAAQIKSSSPSSFASGLNQQTSYELAGGSTVFVIQTLREIIQASSMYGSSGTSSGSIDNSMASNNSTASLSIG